MSHTHDETHDESGRIHGSSAVDVQAPVETKSTEAGNIALISPEEGFDAYDAAHHHGEHEHIHIPPPSYWPILLSFAVTIMMIGLLGSRIWIVVGAVLTVACIFMWGSEGSESIANALTNVPVMGGGDADDKIANGAQVITTDGRTIGRITRASESSPLVRAGWIPTRYGYLARSFIDHIEEGAIYLTITEAEAKNVGNVKTTPAGPNLTRTEQPKQITANTFVIEKES